MTKLSESKAHILDRARDLFSAYGYKGVSIRELADASGLAKASLYHHFRDKHDLYLQVLEMDVGNLVGALEHASHSGGTARERIDSMARAYTEALTTGHSLIPVAFREYTVPGVGIYDFVQRWRDPVLHPLRRVILDGIARGEFREVDLTVATHSLFSLLNAFVAYRLLADPDGMDPHQEGVECFVNLLVEGLIPRADAT